jgi:hypothetical protein
MSRSLHNLHLKLQFLFRLRVSAAVNYIPIMRNLEAYQLVTKFSAFLRNPIIVPTKLKHQPAEFSPELHILYLLAFYLTTLFQYLRLYSVDINGDK